MVHNRWNNAKFICNFSILLIFIGLLTVSSIFAKYAAANMILAYYLMAFGLVNLLEVLLTILIRNPRLDNALTSIFGLGPVEDTKKKVKLKEIKKKKISKNTKD